MIRVLRNLLFSLVLAGAVLGGLEGALRLAGWPDPGLYDGDVASAWTLRRDLPARDVPFRERATTFSVRTNAAGYRGALPGPGAVACLGDSTTFGWGVEEDEAWPARLAAALDRPVLNAGVPGYSTAQGLATLDTVLALKPRVVVLAYLVRDAERAIASDAVRMAAAPPRAPDLALLRAVRALRGDTGGRTGGAVGEAWRVSPAEYVANLRALAARARAAGAQPWLLVFPMRTPPTEHLAALEGLAAELPVVTPTVPDDAFFAEDPIHLTPAGNALVADTLAAALVAEAP